MASLDGVKLSSSGYTSLKKENFPNIESYNNGNIFLKHFVYVSKNLLSDFVSFKLEHKTLQFRQLSNVKTSN